MSSLTSKGYTPCEYIESSGSQYIDTGFKPNQNTRVVMDVWVLQNNSAVAANELFGARTSTSSKAFAVQYNASNTRLQFLYNNGISYETKSSIYSRDLCDANKNSFSFYGASISRGYATFQCDYNLYLLALNNAGVVAYQAIARLYSCQVYDNDTLIRDFKPCRNSSGVYGLFDEVNDVFYTTPSGSFTGNVAETSIKLSQSFRRRLLTISNNVEVDYEKQYFTIEALGSGYISWGNSNLDSYPNHIYYSKNGGAWNGSTTNSSVTVVSGDKVRFKTIRTTAKPTIQFGGTAEFNVYGNIMSLIHGDGFVGNNTLFNSAFERLFQSSSVVDASNLILPATTLAEYCYANMFNSCPSLTTAPELPATTLADHCYDSMFNSCLSLTTAPELPATAVPRYGYYYMFANCTSLTTAPELPATSASVEAYACMFMYCTKLIKAPSKLPAKSTGSYGYSCMFYGCTSLKIAPSEISATHLANYACRSMFYGCTSLTTAPEILATDTIGYCFQEMFYNCKKLTKAPSKLYANTMFWQECDSMFYNCVSLTTAPELLANKLYDSCCYNMFYNCTSLTKVPKLHATILGPYCYDSMFQGCTSLITAPEILATTLADHCCDSMFYNCTSLTTAPPKLPATTLADNCYYSMFEDCTSLKTAPELPATILATSCYHSMFEGCTSLTSAPELSADILAPQCYRSMFEGCIRLNSITMLATNISAGNCLTSWVKGVASSGTFTKHPDMTTLPIDEHGIPQGWTVKNSDGSPVTGGDSGESTTVSVDWTVQTGSWTYGSNSSAWDGKQFTSVSPGSSSSTRLRCTFSGVTSITFNCVYNGENNYDYLTVGNLDSTCTRDSYGTSLQGTSGTAQDITFNCDSGTHYVEFCYSKDSSVDTQPDYAVVYIKNCS